MANILKKIYHGVFGTSEERLIKKLKKLRRHHDKFIFIKKLVSFVFLPCNSIKSWYNIEEKTYKEEK